MEFGNYIIQKGAIGKGSFSTVYKAVNKKTKEIVAIKKINFSSFSNSLKKRINNEIFILKTIQHRNIVTLIDFEYVDNFIFLIFEYCDGSLVDFLEKKHDEGRLANVFREICNGMDYLHSKNIIHRDIKPENILLKGDTPKICDFGFSVMIKDEYSMSSTICGSPLYMSPENLFLQDHTLSTDIWSLGILFYMIAYLEHPFGKLISIEEYRKKIKLQINYPKFFSDCFIDLLKKMLVLEPEERITIKQILDHPFFSIKEDDEILFDTTGSAELEEPPIKEYICDEDYFKSENLSKSAPIYIVNPIKDRHKNSLGYMLSNSLEFILKKIRDVSI